MFGNFLLLLVNFWLLLTTFAQFRPLVLNIGNVWPIVANFGKLASFGQFYQLLVGFGNFWPILPISAVAFSFSLG